MKPLWSCRHTSDVISRLIEEIGARHRGLQLALLQPLGMLVEHGVDDVHKGLVGREEAVPPGQHVALEPAFERVLAQHLHHPPVVGQKAAVRVFRQHLFHPRLAAGLVDRLQLVGGRFIRPKDAEAGHVPPHHIAQKMRQHIGRRNFDLSRLRLP